MHIHRLKDVSVEFVACVRVIYLERHTRTSSMHAASELNRFWGLICSIWTQVFRSRWLCSTLFLQTSPVRCTLAQMISQRLEMTMKVENSRLSTVYTCSYCWILWCKYCVQLIINYLATPFQTFTNEKLTFRSDHYESNLQSCMSLGLLRTSTWQFLYILNFRCTLLCSITLCIFMVPQYMKRDQSSGRDDLKV